MDVHPWAKYEVAHARHEERILRGIAAYNALRTREGEESRDVESRRPEPIRLLDRLLHRGPASARASAESL
jgi:hypothetical protein